MSAALSMVDAGASAAGEHRLSAGAMRAIVRAGAGGRIAACWREEPKGRVTHLLQPITTSDYDPTNWPKGGCYPLVPWSNRIREGRFSFGGRSVDLGYPAALPHGLHGFAQRLPWHVSAVSDEALTMTLRHDAAAGWPWSFEATQRVRLDPAGLTLEISVTNAGPEAMPAGLGVHPYFACESGDRLQFTAHVLWERDEALCGIAARTLDADASRHHAAVGADDTRYLAGFEGIAALARRDGSRVLVETGAPFDHLVLHVPEGAPYACVEPVSHVADAFNLAAAGVGGTGFRVLEPGEALAGVVRMGLA